MKKLSSNLHSLIKSLDTNNRVDVLKQIGESGEYKAVPFILPLLDIEDHMVSETAELAIQKLLASCPVIELAWLNENIRNWRPSPTEWELVTKYMVETIDQVSVVRLSMSSMHWSGYVREAAVNRLIQEESEKGIPFLLLRMNDWVPEIRDIARQALENKRSPQYAHDWIHNISLVDRLLTCGRDVFEPFVQSIHHLLRQRECEEALLEALTSPDRRIRKFAYQAASEAEDANGASIIEQALLDSDTEIRRWASQQVETMLEGERLYTVLLQMKNDSVPSIRRESVALLAIHFPDSAQAILQDKLLDSNMSVRETAQRYLQRLQAIDYSEFYLDVIWNGHDQHRLAAAIAGLGETGKASDSEVLFEYSDHPSISVRKAVLRGLTKLDPAPYASLFIDSLQSKLPGISREASRALLRQPYLINLDKLAAMMFQEQPDHVMRNTLRLLPALGRWKQLELLLDLLPWTGKDMMKAEIRNQLATWADFSNRKYTGKLPEEELLRMQDRLMRNRHEIDDALRTKLEWLIAT
jgi:HEAT repeat protein